MPPGETVVAIRGFARRYRAPLSRLLPGEDEGVLRARPAPGTWSALEYASHVRDVLGWHTRWIEQVLAADRPVLEEPQEGAEAAEENDQAPAGVVEALAARAEGLAVVLEGVPDDGWDRVGLRGGAPRSIALLARTAVHEGSHHLLDIGRGLRAVRTAARSSPESPAP